MAKQYSRNQSANYEELSGKEKGLVKHLSRRNYQLKAEQDECDLRLRVACNMIYEMGGESKVIEYRVLIGGWEDAYRPTIIDDYTNKSGYTSKAHFTQNKRYYGSIKKLGDKPIMCLQKTEVRPDTIHLWKIDTERPWVLIPIEQ